MLARTRIAALLSSISMLAAGTSGAQSVPADVTFEVPLNLTRIHGNIPSVKISCMVESRGFSRQPFSGDPGRAFRGDPERSRIAEVIFPVNQGSVVQNAQIVLPLTDADFENDASGRQATYECKLFAKSPGGQWWSFLPANLDPVRAMTPLPADITGAFVW